MRIRLALLLCAIALLLCACSHWVVETAPVQVGNPIAHVETRP